MPRKKVRKTLYERTWVIHAEISVHPIVEPIGLNILLLQLLSKDFARRSRGQNRQSIGRKEDDPMAKERKVWLQKRFMRSADCRFQTKSQFQLPSSRQKKSRSFFKEKSRKGQCSHPTPGKIFFVISIYCVCLTLYNRKLFHNNRSNNFYRISSK